MELTSIIINFGLFAATVIAAIITWKGVRDSQEARDLAADHESQALAHAKEAATAATASVEAQYRAAEALEEANRRENARDAKNISWVVARAGTSGERWRVTNNSGGVATDVEFEAVNGENIQMEDDKQFRDVAAGQPVFIHFGGGLTDPPTATLKVEWNDSFDRAQIATLVLG